MAFARGAEAVTKAVEEQQGSFGPRLSIFTWRDADDKKILRFLEDDLPLVGDFAQGILTNNEKVPVMDFLVDPDGTNWPEYYHARQKAFNGEISSTIKLRKMGVGIAVLREEVQDPKTGKLIIRDVTQQVEVDGKKFTGLVYGIVKLPLGTFWKKLTGMQRRYGTLSDRDYEVIRRGAKGDKMTDYEVSAIDSTTDEFRDPEKVRARYGYGKKFDESDPQRFMYCPKTLDEWAEEYSGQDRAKDLLEGAGSSNGNGHPVVEGEVVGLQPHTTLVPPVRDVWGSTNEDEAQPVPVSNTSFAGIRSKVLEHFAESTTAD